MKPTKNITITVDKALFDAAKTHPEVERTSLSAFVSTLLRREVLPKSDENTTHMVNAIEEAAKATNGAWKWNRDEIYER